MRSSRNACGQPRRAPGAMIGVSPRPEALFQASPSASACVRRRSAAACCGDVRGIGCTPAGAVCPIVVSSNCPVSSSIRPCSAARSKTWGAQVTWPGSSPPSTAHKNPVSSPTLVKPRKQLTGSETTSPGASNTWASLPSSPRSNRQCPEWTTNTSAVSWLCCELTQCGGWRAPPMLKPCGSAICTCCSGFSDTPGPMMVKFSLASEPGVRVSIKALKQGFRSP